MIVERIEAIPIEIPLSRVFGGSTYAVPTRCTVITRLTVRDGPTAEVYNGDNRAEGREVARLVENVLVPLLVGKDLRDWRRHYDAMFARVPGAAMAPKLLLDRKSVV